MRWLSMVLGALASMGLARPAAAHDSWFVALGTHAGLLALGTGNRFPNHEVAIDARYLTRSSCSDRTGQPAALTPLALTPQALLLRPGTAAATCWAQLQPFDVELTPALVETYFEEARPDDAVRARWAQLRARGLPWIERYTKHARIVLGGDSVDAPIDPPDPVTEYPGPALDLQLKTRDPQDGGLPRAGMALEFRLLDQGRALAGQALELQHSTSRVGTWTRTDAEGRIRVVAPVAGRWLLRGIEIKPAPDRPDAWTSRFVTLAFTLRPAEQARPAAARD